MQREDLLGYTRNSSISSRVSVVPVSAATPSIVPEAEKIGTIDHLRDLMISDPEKAFQFIKYIHNIQPEIVLWPSNSSSLLHYAVNFKLYKITKFLLENGADINAQNEQGNTPFHIAVINYHPIIFNMLIRHKPLMLANKYGDTTLHMAVERLNFSEEVGRDRSIIKIINEYPEVINEINNAGNTALHLLITCQINNDDLIFHFLNNEITRDDIANNIGLTARDLLQALSGSENILFDYIIVGIVARGELGKLKEVLALKPEKIKLRFMNDMSLMHLAATHGHVDMFKFILDLNDNLLDKNKLGMTPLHYAASNGKTEMVKFLIDEVQCDPFVTSCDGISNTFSFAAMGGHRNVIEYLLNSGDTQHMLEEQAEKMLYAAAQHGKVDFIRWLVEEHKVNITPPVLFVATKYGQLDTIKYLCNLYLDWHLLVHSDNQSLMMVAASNDEVELVDYFIGLDPQTFYVNYPADDAKDHYDGENILLHAKLESFKFLIYSDLEAMKHKGFNWASAAKYAADNNEEAILKYILNKKYQFDGWLDVNGCKLSKDKTIDICYKEHYLSDALKFGSLNIVLAMLNESENYFLDKHVSSVNSWYSSTECKEIIEHIINKAIWYKHTHIFLCFFADRRYNFLHREKEVQSIYRSALNSDNVDVVKYLIDHRYINLQATLTRKKDEYEKSDLELIIYNGSYLVLRYLLEAIVATTTIDQSMKDGLARQSLVHAFDIDYYLAEINRFVHRLPKVKPDNFLRILTYLLGKVDLTDDYVYWLDHFKSREHNFGKTDFTNKDNRRSPIFRSKDKQFGSLAHSCIQIEILNRINHLLALDDYQKTWVKLDNLCELYKCLDRVTGVEMHAEIYSIIAEKYILCGDYEAGLEVYRRIIEEIKPSLETVKSIRMEIAEIYLCGFDQPPVVQLDDSHNFNMPPVVLLGRGLRALPYAIYTYSPEACLLRSRLLRSLAGTNKYGDDAPIPLNNIVICMQQYPPQAVLDQEFMNSFWELMCENISAHIDSGEIESNDINLNRKFKMLAGRNNEEFERILHFIRGLCPVDADHIELDKPVVENSTKSNLAAFLARTKVFSLFRKPVTDISPSAEAAASPVTVSTLNAVVMVNPGIASSSSAGGVENLTADDGMPMVAVKLPALAISELVQVGDDMSSLASQTVESGEYESEASMAARAGM